MTDLADWLARIGLGKYTRAFVDQEIDFDLLPLLTESDIRELGLPIGPRRRLLGALSSLRGNTLPRPELCSEAERRQLTIMFVDLAQSTRLALRLDPEAMREVLRVFRDAVTSEVARSGYVAKLMGDGVLAYFGWPQAHEDDARRAVTAALAITEAVGCLDSPTGEKLACRIGIATGMVIVGDLIGEGAAREHAVVGPTPNLAARLQGAAGPGEIMIADTTRRLLGPGFVVKAIGERLLKGHDEPVPLFRVLGLETREYQSLAIGPAELGPIVGRERELAAVRLAWEEVQSGRSRTVLLTGEAGMGKSRLVQAIAEATAEQTAARLLFQCSPLHGDNPFWPVIQRLPTARALIEGTSSPADNRASSKRRWAIVEAMASQVLGEARDGPALLVFEDAQWADRATLELLGRLAVAKTSLLIIITCRPSGEPRLGAHADLLRIALERLESRAGNVLLSAVAKPHRIAPRIRKEILARSDGIPLFIEEITKAVLEADSVDQSISVPLTLRDSLIARLDISPSVKAVAQIASCIGRDFAEQMLLRIADIPREELQQGLVGLLRSGLLLPASSDRFHFKHALVHDIAYETLLTPRRQKLHQRIAEAIEVMPDTIAESEPEVLAHHWFAAGQSERAERYWLRARHRLGHWHEQLDALADYLDDADAAQVIPFPKGGGSLDLQSE
jgi:class 3 adenylate cyclase